MKKKQQYLAPLEGITGYIFRNAVHRHFGDGIDKYFTPFFHPHKNRLPTSKEVKDIDPLHNEGIFLVPQILSTDAEDVLSFEKDMHRSGYPEININLGCPSGTVVSKGRGSGFLTHKEELAKFLSEVYDRAEGPITIKTRLGMKDPDEFYEVLEIYNQYPIPELIIHPRVREDAYKGKARREYYRYAEEHAKMPLCYNGDIWAPEDMPELTPVTKSVMCGRGMVRRPSLLRELSGGPKASPEELLAFSEDLIRGYAEEFSGDQPVLFKMKEIWGLMAAEYPGQEKMVKKLMKAKTLSEFEILLRGIVVP